MSRQPRPVRFATKTMQTLRNHPRVNSVENDGMEDDGRLFVHFNRGWKPARFAGVEDYDVTHSVSVAGAVAGLKEANASVSCVCAACKQ